MSSEICMSLEETNAIRKQLGLKLIKGERRNTDLNQVEPSGGNKDKPQFIDHDNVGLLRKRLARLIHAKRDGANPLLSGDVRDDDWLSQVGSKRHKPVTVAHEEEPEEDLPLLKLSHSVSELDSGRDIVLTLKESSLNDEEGDDVLEDAHWAQGKQEAKNIRLRKLNRDRRRKKVNLQVSSLDLEKEEKEERNDVPNSVLLVGTQHNGANATPQPSDSSPPARQDRVKVQFDDDASDGYEGDFQPVKIKKRKKRDIHSRVKVPSQIMPVQLVDEDGGLEEELSVATVSRPLLKSKTQTPEEIASQIRRERMERQDRSLRLAHLQKNADLVIDENVQFLESLKVSAVDEREQQQQQQQSVHIEYESLIEGTKKVFSGPQEKSPDFSSGLASALQFLQERVIPQSQSTQGEQGSQNDVHHREYNPEVNLIYRDESGKQLTTKEAYKKLSQRFHGTKSNKKKRDKFEARVEARARLQNDEKEMS